MANVDLDMIRKNTMPLIECLRSNKSSQTQHIVFCEEAINDEWHPDKVSIESKNFKAITSSDLKLLQTETVMEKVKEKLN